MATIRKRTLPSGKTAWQCDYRDQSGKRRSKQFERRKDADAFLVRARHEVSHGSHTPDSASISIERAYELFYAALISEGSAPATLSSHNSVYKNHVAPFLAARMVNRIGPADIQDFLDQLRSEGRNADKIRRAKNTLGALLDEAMRQRYASSNPVRSLRPRRRSRRSMIIEEKRIEIPERDEVRRLIEAARQTSACWILVQERAPKDIFRTLDVVEAPYPAGRMRAIKEIRRTYGAREGLKFQIFYPQDWLRPMLIVLAFTGLRIGEARGLAWAHVENGYINVKQAADRFGNLGLVKTVAARRRIPVGSFVVNTLAEWKTKCPASSIDLVFPTRLGTLLGYSNVKNQALDPLQIVGKITDIAGTPLLTPHKLRHFAVSSWIAQAADPKQVSEWVGHESVSFTLDVYGHLFKDRAEDRTFSEAAERAVIG